MCPRAGVEDVHLDLRVGTVSPRRVTPCVLVVDPTLGCLDLFQRIPRIEQRLQFTFDVCTFFLECLEEIEGTIVVEHEAEALLLGDDERYPVFQLSGPRVYVLLLDQLPESHSDFYVLDTVVLHLLVPLSPRIEALGFHVSGVVALPLAEAVAPSFEGVTTAHLWRDTCSTLSVLIDSHGLRIAIH